MTTLLRRLSVWIAWLCVLSAQAQSSITLPTYTANLIAPGENDPTSGQPRKVRIAASGTSVPAAVTVNRLHPSLTNRTEEVYVAFYITNSATRIPTNTAPSNPTAQSISPYAGASTEPLAWQDLPPSGGLQFQKYTVNAVLNLNGNSPGLANNPTPYLHAVAIDHVTGGLIVGNSEGIPLEVVQSTATPVVPFLTSINPNSARIDAPVRIYGSGFSTASVVYFGQGGVVPPGFSIISDTEIRARVPSNASTGDVKVRTPAGLSNGISFGVLNPTTPPVIESFSTPAHHPQAPERGIALPGTVIRIYCRTSSFVEYDLAYVDFNGIRSYNFAISNVQFGPDHFLDVTVPPGVTEGQVRVVTSLGASNGLPYRQPYPQHGPCGHIVCGDQCVPYGSKPAGLIGRLVALHNPDGSSSTDPLDHDWMEYQFYLQTGYFTEPVWESGLQLENVQWQYSYTNTPSDWHDIPGEINRNFQPWDCYETTYYRRVSTHRPNNTGSRSYWYTSNVVTITPSSPPPTPTQSVYYACANSTFTINFAPGAAATTSQWSLPDDTWRVNGGVGVNGNAAYDVGSVTSVSVSVPAGTPAGYYEVHTSSMGPCGQAGYRVIPLVVGTATPSQIRGISSTIADRIYTYRLDGPGGSNFNWTIPGDWTLTSGQGTNTITVRTSIEESYGNVSVSFTDACNNTGGYATKPVETTVPQCKGCLPEGGKAEATAQDAGTALYPNPAAGEVTLAARGQEAQVTFYDGRGVARKVVKIPKGVAELRVNLTDLPEGLYHVRVVSKGKAAIQRQLHIQR